MHPIPVADRDAVSARRPGPCPARSSSPSKRIAILTYGSRGDVQPFVALGVGLQQAGHAVHLAAPAPFAAFVQAHGLALEPLAGNPYELTRAFADRAGLSLPRMVGEMVRHVLPLASTVFRAVRRATRDADLLIHSFLMTDTGHTLARLRGVPDVSAQFFPAFLPTAAFPAVALPDLPLGGGYRRATHLFGNAVFRFGARLLYNRLRGAAPDLPDLAPWPFAGPRAGDTPILFAYSRHVLPRPSDWPAYAHVTGYWQLPPPAGWRPPDELTRFLASGSPPVYFGLGSVRTKRLRDLLRMVISAVRAHGQRLILGVSPRVIEADVMDGDVLAVEDVPHAWLFPRLRFILHHGGAGTTGAAAASGVPSTAIPHSADQAFWARQVHRSGLGPAGTPARRLTRDRLDAILHSALSEPSYRRRAEIVGERIRQEDGVASALGVVEACLARGEGPGRDASRLNLERLKAEDKEPGIATR